MAKEIKQINSSVAMKKFWAKHPEKAKEAAEKRAAILLKKREERALQYARAILISRNITPNF